jgi:glucose-1-phosphate thymidylyltransferase
MKAIIPVAGAGTRLRPLTYTQPKALIPVAGKPLLGYLIEQLQEIGVDEFIFVIGYLGDKIEDYVNTKHPDLKAHFAVQTHREGLGHAIWTAQEFVGKKDEEIIILLGDTIIDADFKQALQGEHSALAVRKVDDPRNFGVAEFDGHGFIDKVVEKPLFPKSNMALVGFYRIKESSALFQSLDELMKEKNEGEEIQLTDALMKMIESGIKFTAFRVNNWFDLGKREVLLETNATMLKKPGVASKNLPQYDNTIIIHPVHIGKGTKINNSIIGPNVTIGENSEINYSILKNSIIGNFTKLDQVILNNSIIGSDALVKGLSQSLNIGDNTEIDLSGAH